jgi:magnesium-transporting ATPase (P-type)
MIQGLSMQGLSEREAQARHAAGQGNAAPPPTSRTYGQIVRENVFTFINNVLFLLGLALVLVGRPLDALVSVGVIGINIAVSVVQEVRAKRTLDRIALLTRPAATVLRDGVERAVAPDKLVVGDVLRVGPGDQIVLDGQVLDGSMQVDESQLSGESDDGLRERRERQAHAQPAQHEGGQQGAVGGRDGGHGADARQGDRLRGQADEDQGARPEAPGQEAGQRGDEHDRACPGHGVQPAHVGGSAHVIVMLLRRRVR